MGLFGAEFGMRYVRILNPDARFTVADVFLKFSNVYFVFITGRIFFCFLSLSAYMFTVV